MSDYPEISEMNSALEGVPQEQDLQTANPARKVALVFALSLIFVRVSMLHTVLTGRYGINIYPLYIFAIPALLGVVVSGGFKRVFRYGVAKYWLLFFGWMFFCVPFSVWRGGAVDTLMDFGRTELPMLLIVAGLVVDWRDCKKVLYTIALATALSLVLFRVYSVFDENGRMSLQRAGIGSIIGNANDYAGYLLFLLPFLLWVVIKSRSFIIRTVGVGAVGYGLYMILLSGSRGAALALAADALFVLLTVSMKKKLMLLALIPVIILGSISFVPRETLQRITTFSSNPDSDNEAVQSQEARTQLFFDAVMCAVTHPLLGVGPGQFVNYEGPIAKNWHNAHNSYAEAASECGFPGLIFYLLALFTTVGLLRKSRSAVKSIEGGEEVDKAAFCMQLALVGYCTAIIFLNFTYFFLLPMMSGLCIGIAGATEALPHRETTAEDEGASPQAHGY